MPVFSAFFRFPLPVIRGVFGSYPPAKPSARPCRSAKRRFRTWTKPSPSAALPRRATCSATGRPSGRLPPRSSSPNPASTKTCSSTFRRRMQPSPARYRRCWRTTSPSAICAAAKRHGGVMHRKKAENLRSACNFLKIRYTNGRDFPEEAAFHDNDYARRDEILGNAFHVRNRHAQYSADGTRCAGRSRSNFPSRTEIRPCAVPLRSRQ